MFIWGYLSNMTGDLFTLAGFTYPTAKGCAYAMRLAYAMILLTCSTNVMTYLRWVATPGSGFTGGGGGRRTCCVYSGYRILAKHPFTYPLP